MTGVKNQVIIQARMGSTRLPGKVLLELNKRPVLEYVVRRAAAAALVNRVVVATSENTEDDQIADWCQKNNVLCVRGSSENVLARYLLAEKMYNCDNIIRVTADCPLIDPGIIDALLSLHNCTAADYTANEIPPTFPAGFDAEVVKTSILKHVGEVASLKSHKEHVTLYIRENTNEFRVVNLDSGIDGRKIRLTLDHPEDYEVLQQLFARFNHDDWLFSYYQIMQMIQRFPEIIALNSGIDRFEGAKKSAARENRKLAWQ